ncbi:MAG: glycosyltransferase [Alphaproteobacteria bacterium]|nr:glycosyltransferase [Alphaproteobacteria bacterium]MBP7759983.1 glycosyltransferase [Alphaproteobacteria bacterium]MBP7763351.1 glycosyltransferase [Alphaproteobacteria bacterium]MBP7905334.1 glycosyltransferase [Alphaproteobacteria bacterium]
MTLPLITIGITAYCAEESIERAVRSALAQDWANTEILIVDDCSTDDTVKVVRQAIAEAKKARLIVHDQNKGAAGARNTILQEAKGDFIVFFDDDDESLPHRLSRQYERIVSYEKETGADLVLCYASGERLYPNGYRKILDAIGSQEKVPHGSGMADRILFYGGEKECFYGSGTPTCSLMARREVFEKAGGFDEHFRRVEDLDFSVLCALMGAHFIGCPEKLFVQHATESSDKSADKNLEAELQLAEKHRAYLELINRYVYAREWPKIRASHFKRDYRTFFATLFPLFLHHPIAVTRHLLKTGPARFFHERKMKQAPDPSSLKILVCCRAIDNMAGGVERMSSALMNEMVKCGHSISLMTLDPENAQSFYPLDPCIVWHKVAVGDPLRKATLSEMIQRALKVRRIVGAVRPDIIIGFQDGPYLSTRVYTLGMGYPIILAERNAPTRYDHIQSGKYRKFIYQTFRFARCITIQCESYRAHYPAYLRARIVTIPNPVFPAAPENLGEVKKRKILLSVGRLEYQKNYSVLIQAFALLAPKHPDWILRIVGEGVERKDLENLIAELDLSGRVELPGTTDKVSSEYAQARLLALPSRWEGFPNVIAEAMAHGVPCVGFAGCAGVSDLIQHGLNGRLAAGNGDPETLADELSFLMSDPEQLVQMGRSAIESVQAYRPEHIYDLWEQLFKEAART